MSQEPPKSQPPLSPKPRASEQETTIEQKTGNSFQVLLKAQFIKVLRGTIRVLEGLVMKLEAEPAPTTAPIFTDKLQLGWSAALAKIRSLLPENLSQKLSNPALTGIIAGIAVILVWTTSALLPGKPQPPEVASYPVLEPVPTSTPTITTPSELTAPAAPEPIEVTPAPEPPEPEPSPTPIELTPEQNLIAAIENQVSEISDRYADGLIQSIQANFEGSRLTIKVGDDWYNLKQSEQDNLAARMLERAKELDFIHLEITDSTGKILARSPVVGTEMVILKRQILKDEG